MNSWRIKKPALNITFSQKPKQDLIPDFIGNFRGRFRVSFEPEIGIVEGMENKPGGERR